MAGVLFVPALLGCTPVGPGARAAYVQEVLLADNRVWLTRDPERVAEKFASMADDRYDFMRGTLALHFADLARPGVDREPTRFLSTADATAVLIVGDPHPENATLCHPEPGQAGEPTLELVDLDAAGFGPWTLDVRRAALGLRTLASALDGCGTACSDAAVAGLATAYAARIAAPEAPSPRFGRVVEDLIQRAEERGPDGHRVSRLTRDGPNGRHFIHDAATRLEPLTREEADILAGALMEWSATGLGGPQLRVLDTARRMGSGISSQPALRFAVLWDTGASGPEDDRLLQIREVVDPPTPPGLALDGVSIFDDNAARVDFIAQTLWSRPDADPHAAGLRSHGYDLKSVSWTDWLQPIDQERIAEDWSDGRLDAADLHALGTMLGDVVAASHTRGTTARGQEAQPVIQLDLQRGGGPEALQTEVLAQSEADLARMSADHLLFLDLLEIEGPLLGADRIAEDVR